MKKTIIVVGISIVFILALFFVSPLFFKKNFMEITKSTLNSKLNGQVDFTDINLSFVSNFPKATLKIKNVTIVGNDKFSADTLLNIASVQATMSISSVFRKSGKSLDELILNKPRLHLIVNELGENNWEITKNESGETEASGIQKVAATQPGNVFELQLNKVKLNDASVLYNDIETKLFLQFLGINFDVSGNMYGTSTGLNAEGKVNDFLLKYKEVEYITKTSLETKALLNLDFETMEFWIIQNELLVNRLPLELIGSVKVPSDSIIYNLQLKTKESSFDNFLALVPPVYDSYLKDVETSGSATVEGNLRGVYFKESYPSFSLNLKMNKGILQFAGLPQKIEKIRADIEIVKPEGNMDLTQVKIRTAHAEINKSPIDIKLSLADLFSDMQFDGSLVGKVNFTDLKNAIPLDSVNVSGIINANLFVKGNYKSIENEQFEKINSVGLVQLDNFVYDSPEYTQRIIVQKGLLEFSPRFMILRGFQMNVGQSDFNITGRVSNYLNYFLKDGIIKGDLQLTSSLVNLNELLRLQKAEKPKAEDVAVKSTEAAAPVVSEEDEKLAFNVPENLDITFRSDIKKAVLDRMPISDITGQITTQGGKLILNGLNMKMLDGELNLTGSYQNNKQNQPFFDFGFNVKNFDIPTAYQTFGGMQKILPMAGRSQGKLSTSFKMKGRLSANHKIIATTLDGTGQFGTRNLQINGSPVFNQLKGILKSEKLQNVTIDDFTAQFTVESGNVNLKPFKTKVSGQEATVAGTLSAKNWLDMRLDFKVNRDAFGTDIQNILSALPGNQKITVLPAGVIITGPVEEPEVKMDLSDARKTITNATKGELQNSLNKLGQGLRKLLEK